MNCRRSRLHYAPPTGKHGTPKNPPFQGHRFVGALFAFHVNLQEGNESSPCPKHTTTPEKRQFYLTIVLAQNCQWPSCSQRLNIPRRALLAYPDSLKLMGLKNGSSDSAPRPLVQAPFVGTRLGFPD